MMGRARYVTPRPFLKWVGGKGQLLPELLAQVEKARPFNRYHEPFVGGGALFFELTRLGGLGRAKAFLTDTNPVLMAAYQGLREDVDGVVALLKQHTLMHGRDYYYDMRARHFDDAVEQAARVIYLNKTCFNGLFRENSKGEFNVPMGSYKNPMICDEDNLRACAEALKHAKLELRSFETVLDAAQVGDLVYFDPPYVPVSPTASFTAYDRKGFGPDAQRRLAEVFSSLDRKGVKVLLSNSYADLVHELYGTAFKIEVVLASRRVNSRADRRGPVKEALVSNF